METRWASPGGDVFQLVPPIFQKQVSDCYNSLGSPVISSNNLWTAYSSLLQKFRSIPPSVAMDHILEFQKNIDPMSCNLEIPLLPNLAPLRNNRYFIRTLDGGEPILPFDSGYVDEGPSVDIEFGGPHRVFVDFSEDDDDSDCSNDGNS